MSAVRITMTVTSEPGTEWDKVINAAALAASEATPGECVILVEARSVSPSKCHRKREWPVWS